jgi:hypothetical protein
MFDCAAPLHCTLDRRHRVQEFAGSLETLRWIFLKEYNQWLWNTFESLAG